MNEVFPVLSGILLGSALGYIRPGLRLRLGIVLATVLGGWATIASGEFRLSWSYLLVDIPLVAVAAAISMSWVHRRRWARSTRA